MKRRFYFRLYHLW